MSAGGQVPSLLMGDEFVVNRDAVDSLGVGFFDKLNSGVMTAGRGGSIKRFEQGGLVEGGTSTSTLGSGTGGDGEMTNNITVNVNMNGEGGGATSSISGGGMNEDQAKGLGDMIQKQIVQTIINEKRAGGILSK